jgi:methylamine dehydrogenase accessory protein MauD
MSGIWLASYFFLWMVALCEAVLLAVLFRQLGLIGLNTVEGISRDGLPIGAAAPSVNGFGPSKLGEGESTTRSALLVFASTSCRPCQALMPALDQFLDEMSDQVKGYVILASSDRSVEPAVLETRSADLIQEEGAADRFRVRVTPFAFVVGVDGRIQAKGLVNNRDHLDSLWRAATAGGRK